MSSPQIAELIELAHAQLLHPGNWSLTTNPAWLTGMYIGPDVQSQLWRAPTGALLASAGVRVNEGMPTTVTTTSMVRPDAEALWDEQRAWIEATVQELPGNRSVEAICEALTDAEEARWQSAGYELIFEELVMEHSASSGGAPDARDWPPGTTLVEWGPGAAVASSEMYVAAFRDRPGYPGWTPDDWIERLTSDDDLLPEASICARIDGADAGYVVSEPGWVGQVGVVPAFRRRGLARALVSEAMARQRALGHETVHLHVNTNNVGAIAAYRGLGFEVVGRRGRFERDAIHR
jgi:ribosomal protein S18 acetylase RimI-like enzyme